MEAERRPAPHGRNAVHSAPAGADPDPEGVRRWQELRDRDACGRPGQSEAALRQLRRSGGSDRAARPRILVIDDDEALCDTIRESLREDYAIASAPQGAAALDLVKAHEPALILVDLRMPIMDGWSFVEQYRRVAALPAALVVMSAAPDIASIATQLGADGHLKKPFDLDALYTCVATHLVGRSSKPPVTDPSGADRPSSPPLG
ncbi:MAG TPA: response regulator [Candidatus Limnocylindria bacterium]